MSQPAIDTAGITLAVFTARERLSVEFSTLYRQWTDGICRLFTVRLIDTDRKHGELLMDAYGIGPTHELAIASCVKLISGNVLVHKPFDQALRRVIYVPKLIQPALPTGSNIYDELRHFRRVDVSRSDPQV